MMFNTYPIGADGVSLQSLRIHSRFAVLAGPAASSAGAGWFSMAQHRARSSLVHLGVCKRRHKSIPVIIIEIYIDKAPPAVIWYSRAS